MSYLKLLIWRLLWSMAPDTLRAKMDRPFLNVSYSLEGEDRVLNRLVDGDQRTDGFYVDVGAHHPQRFSNTYLFYLRGWRGINIDPRPGALELFRQIRPRDINLELAIADQKQRLKYYEFNEPALNSFSKEVALKHDGVDHYRITKTTEIETVTLAEVLDQHLPTGQAIDFLTIDVEGLDESVLRSNNWDKFRPKVVLVEDLEFPGLMRAKESRVVRFLDQCGYELFSRCVNTLIFRLR